MTHAQKLRQKLKRWNTRLRSNPAVSSLMDGVTVTWEGNVTGSASAVPPTSVSFAVPPPSSHPNSMRLEHRISGVRKLQLRTRASSGSVATPPILRVALTLLFASTTTVIQPRRIKSCPTANPLPQATTRTLATSLRPGVS
ncbi:hypothetical protein PF002_g22611 [Phytophthora fragariae]|uniref:Uncharacterized protein n=1 Tax=Phytophthora fragariae TaxID=53985 RepID=A0A6A3XG14_9STRA|nr:hypothetical protein PF002_g22611 [Phytophthora fragariae]